MPVKMVGCYRSFVRAFLRMCLPWGVHSHVAAVLLPVAKQLHLWLPSSIARPSEVDIGKVFWSPNFYVIFSPSNFYFEKCQTFRKIERIIQWAPVYRKYYPLSWLINYYFCYICFLLVHIPIFYPLSSESNLKAWCHFISKYFSPFLL